MKFCFVGVIKKALNPEPEEVVVVYEEVEQEEVKAKGVTSEVTFYYFDLFGRADPLRQMFEYHGQPYKKVSLEAAEWEAQKARGEGGEFGGGLPQATFMENGKEQRLAQFGAILRQFGMRYGYYDSTNFT